MRHRRSVVVAVVALAASIRPAAAERYAPEASDRAAARPLDRFALDDVSREIPPRGAFACPEVDLVRYRGTRLAYQKPLTVHRAFVERLAAFEALVAEVAIRVYGRPPVRIRHLGAYLCRRMKTYPTLLSEHAMGDAIDVEGFDFGPATGAARAAAPRGLRGAFRVRIEDHWSATRGVGALHARFLRALADALIARADRFRVLLGPSYPGHRDHLHLDMSRFRMIQL
jgi:hypothetical protein